MTTAQPLPPAAPAPSHGRRTALVAALTAVVLVVVAGGAWVAVHFLRGGAQAETALPASSLAAVSVDLNPSADQKVEALKTLRKFPEFRKQTGIGSGDDLRKKFFQQVLEEDGCSKLSYAKDVEPWIGDNAGVAAVKMGGKVAPVVALAVTDQDAAGTGLKKLLACSDDDDSGIAFVDKFAVISDSQSHADTAAKQADQSALADDAAYQRWSDKVGDRGVANLYVAKGAASYLRKELGSFGLPGLSSGGTAGASAPAADALADFQGAAGALRFADGGMELEIVGGGAQGTSATAGDLVSRLPDDTAVVLGVSVPKDAADKLVQQLDGLGSLFGGLGSGPSEGGDLTQQLESQLGLSLPDDLRDLLGSGLTLSLGGKPPADLRSTSGPGDVPAGLTVQGDRDKISAVLDKLKAKAATAGLPADGVKVGQDDDRVTVSFDGDYADDLDAGGSLAGTEKFKTVVPEGKKALFVAYVDANSAWRTSIASALSGEDRSTFLANSKPLKAIGVSAWRDGDDTRFLLKVTTD